MNPTVLDVSIFSLTIGLILLIIVGYLLYKILKRIDLKLHDAAESAEACQHTLNLVREELLRVESKMQVISVTLSKLKPNE